MASPRSTPRSCAQLCGIAPAFDVLGDRWSPLVIRDLLLGPLRFGDLAIGLPCIGTYTLVDRLKDLEYSGVVARRLLPHPERGTAYVLTDYGRELEPILMALRRWGTKSMGRLPVDVVSRSRWLVAAKLAFHDESQHVTRLITCELHLTDGVFTLRAVGTNLTVKSGGSEEADLILTINDEDLHELLTHQMTPTDAVASGVATVAGDIFVLPNLMRLVAFPHFSPTT